MCVIVFVKLSFIFDHPPRSTKKTNLITRAATLELYRPSASLHATARPPPRRAYYQYIRSITICAGRPRGEAPSSPLWLCSSNAEVVGIFDTSDNSFSTVSTGALTKDKKFSGAAAVGTKVIFAPGNRTVYSALCPAAHVTTLNSPYRKARRHSLTQVRSPLRRNSIPHMYRNNWKRKSTVAQPHIPTSAGLSARERSGTNPHPPACLVWLMRRAWAHPCPPCHLSQGRTAPIS